MTSSEYLMVPAFYVTLQAPLFSAGGQLEVSAGAPSWWTAGLCLGSSLTEYGGQLNNPAVGNVQYAIGFYHAYARPAWHACTRPVKIVPALITIRLYLTLICVPVGLYLVSYIVSTFVLIRARIYSVVATFFAVLYVMRFWHSFQPVARMARAHPCRVHAHHHLFVSTSLLSAYVWAAPGLRVRPIQSPAVLVSWAWPSSRCRFGFSLPLSHALGKSRTARPRPSPPQTHTPPTYPFVLRHLHRRDPTTESISNLSGQADGWTA
ncbi:hypothetical protein B0H11DRAFT_1923016 [Mycena galericulata]|nr:hypothetical protein B0H11DRAFT_1923016 [Mycena galericulata]